MWVEVGEEIGHELGAIDTSNNQGKSGSGGPRQLNECVKVFSLRPRPKYDYRCSPSELDFSNANATVSFRVPMGRAPAGLDL